MVKFTQSTAVTGTDAEITTSNAEEGGHKNPPTTFLGSLKEIGPGLILAGGIVGSGELIATTSTGGKAGISLLWLIIFGCIIKVLVQIEFARYTIFSGRTTIAAFSVLPGPSLPCCCGSKRDEDVQGQKRNCGHWLTWLWLLSFILVGIPVQSGITGGIGQALAMCFPVTATGSKYDAFADLHTEWVIEDTLASFDNSNRSSLPTYRAMQTFWQTKSRDEQALLNGKQSFVQLCRQKNSAAQRNASNCEDSHHFNFTVQSLMHILGGRQKARDAGADVNTRNATQFFISLGTWPAAGGDDIFWAFVTVVLTSLVLATGRYRFIQHFSAILVLAFTFVSIANLIMLQSDPTWRLTWSDILYGLSFHLEPAQKDRQTEEHSTVESNSNAALAMAMATFGLIGLSPNELIMYPYWCAEKGYAKYTGIKPICPVTIAQNRETANREKKSTWWTKLFSSAPEQQQASTLATSVELPQTVAVNGSELRVISNPHIKTDDEAGVTATTEWRKADEAWTRRANGWIRVLYYDAWLAMFLYTFTTIAFYILGAAILHRTGLEPRGTQMIRYLATMYEPAFGVAARVLFVIGALAVLYSSLFINSAATGRLLHDALVQIRVWSQPVSEKVRQKRIRLLSTIVPWAPLFMVVTRVDPRVLILFGGLLSSAFLPILALAALYFYFVAVDDERIKPRQSIRWLWNTLLCLSAALIIASGVYACWINFK